jgi:hypothetical protein
MGLQTHSSSSSLFRESEKTFVHNDEDDGDNVDCNDDGDNVDCNDDDDNADSNVTEDEDNIWYLEKDNNKNFGRNG